MTMTPESHCTWSTVFDHLFIGCFTSTRRGSWIFSSYALIQNHPQSARDPVLSGATHDASNSSSYRQEPKETLSTPVRAMSGCSKRSSVGMQKSQKKIVRRKASRTYPMTMRRVVETRATFRPRRSQMRPTNNCPRIAPMQRHHRLLRHLPVS